MSDYKAFRIEQVGKIAHVQINRPDKVNAMNADFWREIIEIFQWVDDNDAVRVVVLSGAGKHFSSGIDLMLLASVGAQLPGARASKAGNADDGLDDRHELAAGEFAFHQLVQLGGQVVNPFDPGQLVTVRINQRDAVVGGTDGEGAHRKSFLRFAFAAGEDEAPETVAVQLVVGCRGQSRSPLFASLLPSRSEPPSESTLRACA